MLREILHKELDRIVDKIGDPIYATVDLQVVLTISDDIKDDLQDVEDLLTKMLGVEVCPGAPDRPHGEWFVEERYGRFQNGDRIKE
jgi:hypothetical protein